MKGRGWTGEHGVTKTCAGDSGADDGAIGRDNNRLWEKNELQFGESLGVGQRDV